jgi:transposase
MEASGFITDNGRAWRRLQALSLKQDGWYQRDIAAALGVSEVSVSRWLSRARQGGPEALLARPVPGHPPKLSAAQKDLIPEFLWHGPEAFGFRGAVWTCARIAQVIEEECGVRYHKDHVSRLLKELHWTPKCRSPERSNGMSEPSGAGETRCGQTCNCERDTSGGC